MGKNVNVMVIKTKEKGYIAYGPDVLNPKVNYAVTFEQIHPLFGKTPKQRYYKGDQLQIV